MTGKIWSGDIDYSNDLDSNLWDLYMMYMPFSFFPLLAICLCPGLICQKRSQMQRKQKIFEIIKMKCRDTPDAAIVSKFQEELKGKTHSELDQMLALLNAVQDAKNEALRVQTEQDLHRARMKLVESVAASCSPEEAKNLLAYLNTLSKDQLQDFVNESPESLRTKCLRFAASTLSVVSVVQPLAGLGSAALSMAADQSAEWDKQKAMQSQRSSKTVSSGSISPVVMSPVHTEQPPN